MEKRYELFMQVLPEILYEVRITENPFSESFQFVSNQIEKQLGFEPQEFLENSTLWIEIIHPSDKEKFHRATQELLNKHCPVTCIYRMRHKTTGRYIWFEDKSVALFDEESQFRGYCGIVRDISEQKRIEKLLHDKEEQYRLLAENISDVIWILDTDTGRFRFISPSVKKIRGYSIEEALSQKPEDSMTPASWQKLSKALPDRFENFKRGIDKQYIDEIEQPCRDGSTVWVEVTSRFVKNKETNHIEVFGSSKLITKRKAAEQSLTIAVSKYKTLFEILPIGITVCDKAGNIVETNSYAERLLGISHDEHLQRQIDGMEWRIIHPDGTLMHNSEYAGVRALNEGTIIEDIEMGIVKPSGQTIWVNATATPVEYGDWGAIIAYTDITERKKNDAELTFHAMMLSKINDAVIAVDEKQRILYWNKKAEEVYGWKAEEVIGKTGAEVLQTNFIDQRREEVIKIILGEGKWRGRVTQLTRTNNHVWVEASIFGFRNDAGALTGYVTVNRDITEQIHFEEMLQENASRYKAIIEQAGDAYFVHDLSGRFTEVNKRACDSLGYTREELLQMSVPDVECDFDMKSAQKEWATIEPEKPFTLYGHHRRKDGTVFPVELRFGKFQWKGEPIFLALVRDITEQESAKKALAVRNELFQLMGTMLKVGGWEFDTSTMDSTWTDEVSRIHDLEPGNALNVATGLQHFVPESRVIIEAALQDAIQHGTPYDLELQIRSAKGKLKWIRTKCTPEFEAGSVVKIRGVIQDITELKQEHERVQELETRYQNLFNHMIEGIAYCKILFEGDTPVDYIHISVNPAFEQLTGLKDIIGKKISDVIPGIHQDNPILLETYSRVSLNGEPERFENYVPGLKMWFSISVFCPHREHVVIVFDNITTRKNAEEQLNKTITELELSNKELERFAYVASHDLQEPLRALTAMTQLLKRRTEGRLDERGEEYIYHIVEASERMQMLINDLLEFSRIDRRTKRSESVSLTMVLHKVLENLSVVIHESGATITFDPMPTIFAVTSQMTQVFQNLINNGIKFHKTEPPEIHIGVLDEGEYWKFWVKDNGIGIEPQYFDRIFILFQRLHTMREYSGTGMGLAICKKIVEHHGGKIWVESEFNKGSIFYFTIHKRKHIHDESN